MESDPLLAVALQQRLQCILQLRDRAKHLSRGNPAHNFTDNLSCTNCAFVADFLSQVVAKLSPEDTGFNQF